MTLSALVSRGERTALTLDPWGGGPPAELMRLVEPSRWIEHRTLPVGTVADTLVVATAGRAAALVEELRGVSYREVAVVAAPAEDIEVWLDVGVRGLPWHEAVSASLARTLRSLGLHAREGATLPSGDARDTAVAEVASTFEIAEEAAREVLALRARLPQVRPDRYVLGPFLAPLLPREDAESIGAVPLLVRGGMAVVGSSSVLGAAARRRISAAVGMEVRLALSSPSHLRAALQAVYRSDPDARRGVTDRDVHRELVRMRVLDRARQDAVERVAAMTGEPVVAAIARLGYATGADLRRASAAALEMELAAGESVDPDLASLAGPAAWRRWRCVPVTSSPKETVVLADAPLTPTLRELVRRVLGANEVRDRYVPPDELESLLAALPAALARTVAAEDHLVAGGLVTPEQLAQARRRAARDRIDVATALVEQKSATVEDVTEARAIAAGLSWVHPERYAPEPDAVEALPEDIARNALALPLRRDGRCLVVAFMNEVRTGAVERAVEHPIVPVLAVAGDASAVLDRWYAPRSTVLPAYQLFARTLVGRGVLARPQVDAALEALAHGRALDVSLVGRGLLSADQLAFALAEHARAGVADLAVRERTVSRYDALGRERLATVWEDPVDPRIARLLPRELAERHVMIAFRRLEDATILLAIADPLDEPGITAARASLGSPLRIQVATRRDIAIAQRRAYARPSLGERLLEAGVISRNQLERAVELHDRAGVRLGAALVSLGFVTEAELAAAIADQSGLRFLESADIRLEVEVARRLPHERAGERGWCPLEDDGRAVAVACTDVPSAADLEELRGVLVRPVRPVIVAEGTLEDLLQRVWRDAYAEISAAQLLSRSPEDSARWVLSRGQKIFFSALALATLAGLALAPVHTVTAFVALSTFFYVGFSAYKFYLAYRAVGTTLEIETTPEDVAALDDRDLPVYTILVPVYREARVFPILARAIARLDYPAAKLDVKVLLEEDDTETIEVARRAGLPSSFQLLVVPHGQPKGKPKACNYGLIHAKGEFVVIFDAEDIPEPDQLKKAIVAFRKGDARLACVQAKLNYFNRDQNLLTRWFTTEYSMWFDLFLPGLDASNAPIPLGGTSNHFRTTQLRELGAWDPHNVTEDADLGMRLYKRGWTTAVIDSTTFEEANSELYNWIRQRSRWVKGYIQTYLVHMRHPWRLYRQIGFRGFLSFQFVVGGTFFGYLVNPIYWLLTATWFLFQWGIIREIFPAPVFYVGAVGLYLGNFAFTYLNVAGCLRREYYDMVKYALLSPVYWAFMSVAAWKGFLQLFYRPSYWEKTEHGLYRGEIRVRLRGATTRVGGDA